MLQPKSQEGRGSPVLQACLEGARFHTGTGNPPLAGAEKPREDTAKKRFCTCSGLRCWKPAASIPYDALVGVQKLSGTHSGEEAELPWQVFTRSQSLYPSSQDGTRESILGHHGVLTSRPLDNAQGILRWILWLCV